MLERLPFLYYKVSFITVRLMEYSSKLSVHIKMYLQVVLDFFCPGERTSSDTHSAKWLLNRSNESSHIKAFSGTGRTLGGGDKVSSATNDAIDQVYHFNK